MPKIRVLVVEDESLVARDIQHMLRSLNYEVLGVVTSGEMALQKAAASVPDLVLMDIILKGEIDGITAAEKLWEEFNIPVVYLTAYADETTFQRAKLTKPFGYLLKPFEERELQTTIEMALYKSKMELKLREREEWLSTVLKSIGDGIIATDREGLVTFMNPLAEKMTGWTQDEALSRPLPDVFGVEGPSPGKVSRPEKGGGAILPEANIIIVTDVVEAMSSHRPYRSGHGIDKAIAEITQNKGVLYDAAVVDHCVRLFKEKGFSFE